MDRGASSVQNLSFIEKEHCMKGRKPIMVREQKNQAPVNRILVNSKICQINLFLFDILEPIQYLEWFDQLLNCPDDVEIIIHINSSGGQVSTALQLISLLLQKKEAGATIKISVEGDCCSAATLFLPLGDSFSISPLSSFMFHDISYVVGGKTNGEMLPSVMYSSKWGDRIFEYFYKNLLTKEEIQTIRQGKDLWFDAFEMEERIIKFVEMREEEEMKQQEEEQELFNEVQKQLNKATKKLTSKQKKTQTKTKKNSNTRKEKKERESEDKATD